MSTLVIFTGALTAASFAKYDSITLYEGTNSMWVVRALAHSSGQATLLTIAGQKELKNAAAAKPLLKRLGLKMQYDRAEGSYTIAK